MGARD
jgi:putative toxin-antitoxin system antitoxin component (TIGR02293 family)